MKGGLQNDACRPGTGRLGGSWPRIGRGLEATGTNFARWPGGNLPPDVGNQVAEQEFMKADEYDHFLADSSDFIVWVWLPRAYSSLQPLANLPPLMDMRTSVVASPNSFCAAGFGSAGSGRAKATGLVADRR